MSIEAMFAGLKFSEIKGCQVYDKDNTKIGKLQDAVFVHKKDGLHLSKFTIGGSFLEELMEDFKVLQDVDPVFPVDTIKSVGPNEIKLNCSTSELKSTTVDSDAIAKDEIKLSNLSDIKLIDSKEEKIGNIIDIKFEMNAFQLIVGDGMFPELLEDIGLRSDIDFLLSPRYIDSISSTTLKLSGEKANLNLLFSEAMMPDSVELKKKTKDGFKTGIFYPSF